MNDLSQQFIGEIKTKLTEEMNRLQMRIQELKAQDPYQDPDHVNDNAANDTEANEEAGHERLSALSDELTSQRDAVEMALLRIGDGTFGICSNCGKSIGEERLRINPTADKCVDCQKIS